tara:strand:- start:525 stop:989 length:465 start_codon:yes stop_codon:yes gene_type:complete
MSKKIMMKQDMIKVSDISKKKITKRTAVSEGFITLSDDAIKIIETNQNKKGNVIAVAKIAGIMAAKQTPSLIPLTHIIQIDDVDINITLNKTKLRCETTVTSLGKTGVEIESLLATEICLLTIYDMCKYIDKSMIISEIKLIKKTGGKSGDYSS